ncbi:MAG: glycoside hydrolase family 2 TIM barrel-domain containing protein [Armatimonadota bacterium]
MAAITGGTAVADIPWPEHPRPNFVRDQWVNLNGAWDFDFDREGVGDGEGWHEPGKHSFSTKIAVPFPWEARLSGIGDIEYQGVAWYARRVTVPADWQGKRAWLCFGAVDWSAKVWANGEYLGEHVGGYTPFAFDITPHAGPGETAHIIVRAEDTTSPEQPVGKQIGWYTRTSGIWQTVYLEARGATFIENFQFVTKLPSRGQADTAAAPYRSRSRATVETTVFVGGESDDVTLKVDIVGAKWAAEPGSGQVRRLSIRMDGAHLWSPDDPHLYDVVLRLLRGGEEIDRVSSYLGMREISALKAPGRDYRYVCINGRPVYLRGALHQSFHPDGIYQYPDDAMLRWDYEYCNRIGINFLRIHIKSEIPRALYWADRHGVLIMEDQPNFRRYTEASRENWEAVLVETVRRDFNHPSIFSWCNFNETWGIGDGGYDREHQLWVKEMYELTKRLDPTRLCEDNSANRRDHVVTDINSFHFYINDYERAQGRIDEMVENTYPGSAYNYAEGFVQGDAPLINSEYGGISAGMGDQDISWCFKFLTNELRKHDKMCGYVYTEQSDIEWEHNGFLNYDRSEKVYGYEYWFPGFSLADINGEDFVVLDIEPCPVLQAGATLSVPAAISHWSDREGGDLRLRWSVDYLDRWGERHERVASGSRRVDWKPFEVTPAGMIEVSVPDDAPALGALCVWLEDGPGERVAANYINFHVHAAAPRVEAVDGKRLALRFAPSDVAEWEWPDGDLAGAVPGREGKTFGRGHGYAGYELAIPDEVPVDGLSGITLLLEVSAKAGDERLSWPARKKPVDYPQSDKDFQWPTDMVVSINGAEVLATTLPDDPADARGALSHQYRFHPGSYGWLVRAEATKQQAAALRVARRHRRIVVRLAVPEGAEHEGGLAVFGERLGRYPTDPTIILSFKRAHGLGADFTADTDVVAQRLTPNVGVVVPTAETQPAEWRYTTERPPRSWASPDFDDSGWQTGRGGFGTRGTPNAIVNTVWRSGDIWLRKRFDLEGRDELLGATLRLYHDEDAEVYLNDEQILRRRGYVSNYVEEAVGAEGLKLLRAQGNVLAVHCRQTSGGQNIDVGLTVFRKGD